MQRKQEIYFMLDCIEQITKHIKTNKEELLKKKSQED